MPLQPPKLKDVEVLDQLAWTVLPKKKLAWTGACVDKNKKLQENYFSLFSKKKKKKNGDQVAAASCS